EARAFIDAARSRFPDARHHCSAYIYHVDESHPVERSSDDGEPSGTAGKPMLDVLKGSGMMDIAAVVIRYFGRSEERRVGNVTGVQTCALPILKPVHSLMPRARVFPMHVTTARRISTTWTSRTQLSVLPMTENPLEPRESRCWMYLKAPA